MSAVAENAARLPTPADRPGADVVLYDGHCKFCTAGVQKLARFDRGGRLAFLSLHDAEVGRRWPELGHDELMQYLYLVTPEGRKFRGAEAFKYLSTRLPSLYWMAPLMYFPFSMPVWQFFYRMFAKRRYRFGRIESCEDGSCRIPPRR
jgi:predicted DCC family thiol-disulfide oxidoreductase YuxK